MSCWCGGCACDAWSRWCSCQWRPYQPSGSAAAWSSLQRFWLVLGGTHCAPPKTVTSHYRFDHFYIVDFQTKLCRSLSCQIRSEWTHLQCKKVVKTEMACSVCTPKSLRSELLLDSSKATPKYLHERLSPNLYRIRSKSKTNLMMSRAGLSSNSHRSTGHF